MDRPTITATTVLAQIASITTPMRIPTSCARVMVAGGGLWGIGLRRTTGGSTGETTAEGSRGGESTAAVATLAVGGCTGFANSRSAGATGAGR
jgi:hypothetical protein